MSTVPLFPALLGNDFVKLAPAVRDVHCGQSLVLQGRADVSRGNSRIARILCTLGRLARDQRDGPVRVVIEAQPGREVWTRYFGGSPIMRSVFSAHRGTLRERCGPVALEFTLCAEQGAVIWKPEAARMFGLPIPRRWLSHVAARAFEESGSYAFQVRVAFPALGTLIAYRGRLGTSGSQSAPAPGASHRA